MVTAKQPNAQISTNGSRPERREPPLLIPVHTKNWPYFGFRNKSNSSIYIICFISCFKDTKYIVSSACYVKKLSSLLLKYSSLTANPERETIILKQVLHLKLILSAEYIF